VKISVFQVQEGYEWVVPVDDADFELFRTLAGSSQTATWKPVQMRLVKEDERGRPFQQSDIPWLGRHAPVLRERAAAALASVLLRDGELLPLECSEAALVLFNVTTVRDALDLDRSVVVRFPSSGRIMDVKSPVFRPDRLRGVRAFKVPELLRGSVFVNDDVVATAQGAGLVGVGFRLVWDRSAPAER
jgi:hypothetical protein